LLQHSTNQNNFDSAMICRKQIEGA